MAINKIRKRDGSLVDFDSSKISAAIEKAVIAVRGKTTNSDIDGLTNTVVARVEDLYADGVCDVEGVQDIVEQTLMRDGYFDVAKAYILYRERHSEMRKERTSEILKKIDQKKLMVINRKGEREVFEEKTLRDFIRSACRGYEGVIDVEELLGLCEKGLYDEIPTKEISKLVIMTARGMIERDPSFSMVTGRLFLASLYKEVIASSYTTQELGKAYADAFVNTINEGVKNNRLDKRMLDFDLGMLSAKLKIQRDELIPYRGMQTLYDRYFLADTKDGRHLETPQAFWMRVAMGLSLNEADRNAKALEFYEVLSTLKFVSSTPTLFHSGMKNPQLSSCYLTTVGDDLKMIFKAYSDNALLSKWSGGLGNDWSSLRATGGFIKSTAVESQGVIPFLKIANDVTVAINRSGKRRGATCAYLEAWHYDIEDFIDLRRNTGDERRRTHDMDIAVWVPDLLIKRVLNNEGWTLMSPDEAPELHELYGNKFEEKYMEYEARAARGEMKLRKQMKAKDLWKKILISLYETGHPWITFKDPSNIRSPQDHVGVVHCSNLCTEITLNTSKDEIAVCNLGSINLAKHITNGRLDEKMLQSTTRTAMRMLDNVIDICYYPVEEAKYSNFKHRPVGLGIMGFQDALYMLGINFDSDEAVRFADESMELISYNAILASSELAKERGPYETFKGSKWDRGILPMDTIDLLEAERGVKIDVPRGGKLDWTTVRESIKRNGMRNSNCLAIAPTATISNISGCFPSIEPMYNDIYVKSNMSGEFTVINQYLVEDLKALGLWNQAMLDEIKAKDGGIQKINSIPTKLKEKYKNVFEIEPEWLIKIAAYRGKWIDQSQSLNIFTNTLSGKRLSDTYLYAWKMGLKTTYYLRTMGASTIEKNTVDIMKQKTKANMAEEVPPITVSKGAATLTVAQPVESVQAAVSEVWKPIEFTNVNVTMDGENCDACQ